MTNHKERPIETEPRVKPQSGEIFIERPSQNGICKLCQDLDVSAAHEWAGV